MHEALTYLIRIFQFPKGNNIPVYCIKAFYLKFNLFDRIFANNELLFIVA
jgi:hypothetical protein